MTGQRNALAMFLASALTTGIHHRERSPFCIALRGGGGGGLPFAHWLGPGRSKLCPARTIAYASQRLPFLAKSVAELDLCL